jgi:hypothetical protein
MSRVNWKWGTASGVLLVIVATVSIASSEETVTPRRVPVPVVQEGKGQQCVEPTDFMRKNHMLVLMHHRDKTVHEGIRTRQHSLKNCVECHASEKTNNSVIGSKDAFCQGCHSYAAVQLDCFECHASKPATASIPHPGGPATP